MFGCIVPGAFVSTQFVEIASNPGSFLYEFAQETSSFILFLTAPLPPEYWAGVYSLQDDCWKLIGSLRNEEASAVFSLSVACTKIGISLTSLHQQLPIVNIPPVVHQVEKVAKSFINFASSFGTDVISLQALTEWYKKVISRLQADPKYLDNV